MDLHDHVIDNKVSRLVCSLHIFSEQIKVVDHLTQSNVQVLMQDQAIDFLLSWTDSLQEHSAVSLVYTIGVRSNLGIIYHLGCTHHQYT